MRKILNNILKIPKEPSPLRFRDKIRLGIIDKGMKDAQFLFYEEFAETEDGKIFDRDDKLDRYLRGCFMISSQSLIPYVIVDTTLADSDGTPEDAIDWFNRILFHELTHQLCSPEFTWNESLAGDVEFCLTYILKGDQPIFLDSIKKAPIVEVQ